VRAVDREYEQKVKIMHEMNRQAYKPLKEGTDEKKEERNELNNDDNKQQTTISLRPSELDFSFQSNTIYDQLEKLTQNKNKPKQVHFIVFFIHRYPRMNVWFCCIEWISLFRVCRSHPQQQRLKSKEIKNRRKINLNKRKMKRTPLKRLKLKNW
jgi:hypothetical protein